MNKELGYTRRESLMIKSQYFFTSFLSKLSKNHSIYGGEEGWDKHGVQYIALVEVEASQDMFFVIQGVLQLFIYRLLRNIWLLFVYYERTQEEEPPSTRSFFSISLRIKKRSKRGNFLSVYVCMYVLCTYVIIKWKMPKKVKVKSDYTK